MERQDKFHQKSQELSQNTEYAIELLRQMRFHYGMQAILEDPQTVIRLDGHTLKILCNGSWMQRVDKEGIIHGNGLCQQEAWFVASVVNTHISHPNDRAVIPVALSSGVMNHTLALPNPDHRVIDILPRKLIDHSQYFRNNFSLEKSRQTGEYFDPPFTIVTQGKVEILIPGMQSSFVYCKTSEYGQPNVDYFVPLRSQSIDESINGPILGSVWYEGDYSVFSIYIPDHTQVHLYRTKDQQFSEGSMNVLTFNTSAPDERCISIADLLKQKIITPDR